MKRYIAIMLFAGLAGCQPTLVAEFDDKAVVQAYLYAGHPPVLRVSKLIAFRDDVVYSDENVDGLTVTITDDTTGESSTLTSGGEGVYSTGDMEITAGHTYSLSMPYNGADVTATTVIPGKPVGIAISKEIITAMGFPDPTRQGFGDRGAEITWDNPEEDYYMLAVENIEANPKPIFDVDEEGEEDWPRPSFRIEPTQGASAALSAMSFSYYGWHNVILIRMRPEYVLLYSSSGSSSQALTEIHANVVNGYGIFTGANCDTVRVKVVESGSLGFVDKQAEKSLSSHAGQALRKT